MTGGKSMESEFDKLVAPEPGDRFSRSPEEPAYALPSISGLESDLAAESHCDEEEK